MFSYAMVYHIILKHMYTYIYIYIYININNNNNDNNNHVYDAIIYYFQASTSGGAGVGK